MFARTHLVLRLASLTSNPKAPKRRKEEKNTKEKIRYFSYRHTGRERKKEMLKLDRTHCGLQQRHKMKCKGRDPSAMRQFSWRPP